MLKRVIVVGGLAFLSGACTTGGSGSGWSPDGGVPAVARYLSIDGQLGQSRRGPIFYGYIRNSHGLPAADVQLLVEGLDPAGNVQSRIVTWVPGDVPAGNRSYYEVPVDGKAASYRGRVYSAFWRNFGGG